MAIVGQRRWTAAYLVGMQAISQLYLPDKFTRASQLYGAIERINSAVSSASAFFFCKMKTDAFPFSAWIK